MINRSINCSKTDIDSVLSHLGLSFEEVLELQRIKSQLTNNPKHLKKRTNINLAVKDFLTNGFAFKSFKTKLRYENVINDFRSYLAVNYDENMFVDEITMQQCEDYLLFRKTKRPGRHQSLANIIDVAAPTYNLKIAALRKFFNFCIKKSWVVDSPMANIERQHPDETLPSYLKLHECIVLLKVAQCKLRFGKRDHAITAFMIYLGARIEETVMAKIQDIDFERNCIILKGVKAGGNSIRERILPLMGDLSDILRDWIQNGLGYKFNGDYVIYKKSDPNWLFINQTSGPNYGEQMHQDNIRLIINRLYSRMNNELIRLNFPPNQMKLTPHSLRHSFAILALDSGINPTALMNFMGHQSLESTSIYLRLRADDCRKAGEKFHPLVNLSLDLFIKDLQMEGSNHESPSTD